MFHLGFVALLCASQFQYLMFAKYILIFKRMPSPETLHQSRRSTRVPLKVLITVEAGAASRTCKGETMFVNLHGASLTTTIGLNTGMKISIHVYLTDKRVAARVVFVDPKNPLHCGIELAEPQNIWGVNLPPEDWEKTAALESGR